MSVNRFLFTQNGNPTSQVLTASISDVNTVVSNAADLAELAGLYTPPTTTVAAKLDMKEGTNNGTNKVTIKPADSLSADVTMTLPSQNGVTLVDTQIGTSIQAYSANLDEYAAVNPTTAGLALLDDADAAAQRTTLGLTSNAVTALTHSVCQGRLTGTSGSPITLGAATSITTLYFTPVNGNLIGLHNGSSTWTILPFTELSLAVPATTNTVYDVFAYNNNGTVAIESLVWTNTTTRATAIVFQDGVPVKSGDSTRRLIGTFATGAVSGETTDDGSTGRLVYNLYNQVPRHFQKAPTNASWTHSAYGTWRNINNDATDTSISIVNGGILNGTGNISAWYKCLAKSSSTNVNVIVGISINGNNPAPAAMGFGPSLTSTGGPCFCQLNNTGANVGIITIAAMEYLDGSSDTVTYYKTKGAAAGALAGIVWM